MTSLTSAGTDGKRTFYHPVVLQNPLPMPPELAVGSTVSAKNQKGNTAHKSA